MKYSQSKYIYKQEIVDYVDVCVFCLDEQRNKTECCSEVCFGIGCLLNTGEMILQSEYAIVTELPVGASNVCLSN